VLPAGFVPDGNGRDLIDATRRNIGTSPARDVIEDGDERRQSMVKTVTSDAYQPHGVDERAPKCLPANRAEQHG